MNIRNIRVCIVLLLLTFWCMPSLLFAQDDGNNGSTTSMPFQLDLNSSFNGLFFQDQIGLRIAGNGLNIENQIEAAQYVLGPNDLISINIEGSQPIQMRGVVVNPQGDIVIPVIGVIPVSGKTILEAQEEISGRVSEIFKSPNVEISLDQPRPLTIHINGEIPHPGKYVIPAQSRIDFAIFQSITDGRRSPDSDAVYSASDLLDQNYSYRNILIEHKDGRKDTADLVSYYSTGNSSKNPMVDDGDKITIFKAQKDDNRISVSGAVRSPFEVQFLESDTPYSLLQIAGGFNNDADTTTLVVLRRKADQIERLELPKNDWRTFSLHPNDRIIALTNENDTEASSAWVSGEVSMPGNFPIINGTTTAFGLIEMAGGFTNQALPQAGYLLRAGSIENELPNKFNAELMKRTSDQLIQGLEYLDLENKLSQNRVHVDLTDDQQLQQVKLFDGDRLFVPRDENTIFVFGQVNNPGYFPFAEDNRSVQNYISRAGGLSLAANPERIYIIKAGNKSWYKPENTTLQSGDMIFVDREPYDELNAQRSYQVQTEQLKNSRIQLIMTGLTTITSVITTLIAIDVINK